MKQTAFWREKRRT